MSRRSVLAWVLCACFSRRRSPRSRTPRCRAPSSTNQRGVLPGVTVTATEISTGRQSIAVTLEDGRYRLENLPPGRYTLRIELPGFATAEIAGIELLVGANATVPPIDDEGRRPRGDRHRQRPDAARRRASSQVAGNIDRRQMAELPLQGRNWQELSLMVKGITANNIGNTPGAIDDQFQLNLDGQQITQRVAGSGFGQPKVSREAIAEFQIVTNMFDITQGRSTGMQVQAISRSGTNDLRGVGLSASSAATSSTRPTRSRTRCCRSRTSRSAARSAARSCANKAHFFGSYEYERQPRRPRSWRRRGCRTRLRVRNQGRQQELPGARRLSALVATNTFTVRGAALGVRQPVPDLERHGPPVHGRATCSHYTTNLVGTWTHVVSNNLMMQVHGGYNGFSWYNDADPVERRAVPQHAVLRAAVQRSRPDARRAAELSRTTRGRTPTAAGWTIELAQGRATT